MYSAVCRFCSGSIIRCRETYGGLPKWDRILDMLSEKVTVWQRWKKRSAPEACFLDARKCIQRCKQFLVGASLIFSPFDKYHHVPNKSLRSRMTRITCFICWNPVGRGDSWWFTTFMIHCFGNRGSLSAGLVTGHSNFTRPAPFCPYVGRAFSSIKMIHPRGQMLLVCTRERDILRAAPETFWRWCFFLLALAQRQSLFLLLVQGDSYYIW